MMDQDFFVFNLANSLQKVRTHSAIRTMTERQRLIYVACSRATQFLALAIPKSIADEIIRKSLAGVNIEIRYINIQGELAFAD